MNAVQCLHVTKIFIPTQEEKQEVEDEYILHLHLHKKKKKKKEREKRRKRRESRAVLLGTPIEVQPHRNSKNLNRRGLMIRRFSSQIGSPYGHSGARLQTGFLGESSCRLDCDKRWGQLSFPFS